ncbi:MAG: C-terminal binding protein [Verrucomicrobia bacterium]|nr:C-terminal binding protein [Verrucomicrobiota bacterium]
MSGFKVVALRHDYPSTHAEQRVVRAAGGAFVDTDGLSFEEALCECEDADAILVRWVKLGPELLRRFRRCRIVVRYGVGYDNVDLAAATEAGILVGHAPAYCLDEVATQAMALLLACVRNVIPVHHRLARGGWEPNPPEKSYRMAGRTLGLVGFGNIGQSMARKVSGWRLRVMATDPFVEPARADALGVRLVDLETLCRQADYVSLHAPLLPETRHLISRREFAWMKPGVIVVNTARGPVLHAAALLEALEAGRVAAAGLDVFEEEPLAASSPLRTHPRLVLSDHTAWYSEESVAELQRTVAEEAVRVCTGGLPLALANPEVLERLGRAAEWVPNDTARWQMKRLAWQRAQSSAPGGSA